MAKKGDKAKLSQLSGKVFDRAYITSMLRDHAKNAKDFEQHSLMGENKEVRVWAASALPVIQEQSKNDCRVSRH